MRSIGIAVALCAASGLLAPSAAGAQVVRENVDGIRNFARVESTVACAGAITADAIAGIKKMGYSSIINLRLASEPGADVEIHTAAAKTVGIRYVHIPFSSANPDPAAVDAFLAAITAPGAAPAFVH